MKLATLTPDGWPYLVPVWYDYDGEDFLLAGPGNVLISIWYLSY